jgi:LytS/YehU family sensor histidine kinase
MVILLLTVQPQKDFWQKEKYIAMSFVGVFTVLPAIISFYGSYFFLIPLINRKKHKKFVIGVFIIMIISITTTFFSVMPFVNPKLPLKQIAGVILEVSIMLGILSVIHGTLGLVVKGFINWYQDIKWKEQITQKNLEIELALIKSQIDPHFLFNTLNNIDILIEKDAQKASLYLNKLSEIMRFMLYETKTERIPLQKEVEYIAKYMDLQKIRTSNPDFATFSVEGNIQKHTIAPMIFIPFIENAFKYAPVLREGNVIEIQILVNNNSIDFFCKNKVQNMIAQKDFGGLGNDLIQKRLELLYAKKQTLEVKQTHETYEVHLNIKTDEN